MRIEIVVCEGIDELDAVGPLEGLQNLPSARPRSSSRSWRHPQATASSSHAASSSPSTV